ncbi:M20/M25/M40 family metallo-hydrolase [Thermodesulfobacteriota bacterium]
MIDTERLVETFKCLVAIDSQSKEEKTISAEIERILSELGAETHVDNAAEKTGSNTGNLFARFNGNTDVPPLLLNAHMDTVSPGTGITAVFKDGIFTSDGATILGADDKSAIAILIETIRVLIENELPHGPLEVVFTVCEEIGLLGAKHLDFGKITARYGFALDATDTGGVITRAPSANRLEFKVHGKDAHAGAAPEKGINAIALAGKAIAGLEIGRVDRETTCNIGVIEGGDAINIVPKLVTVKGEVRSHNEVKLDRVTDKIVSSFEDVIDSYKRTGTDDDLPRLDVLIERDFSYTHIPENHPVVSLARQASENLGREMVTKTTGGGADANIFFEKGIVTGVLGTGMKDMHTVRESISLADMIQTTELMIEIISLHAKGKTI